MIEEELGDGMVAVSSGVTFRAGGPYAGIAVGICPVRDQAMHDIEVAVCGGYAKWGVGHLIGADGIRINTGIQQLREDS